MSAEPVRILFDLGLGPWCLELNGKIPLVKGWRKSGPVDEATVRGWLAAGHNVGVRTGRCSGVVVVDDDRPKHGLDAFDAPPTGLVAESPTGSRHYFYRLPPGEEVRNSTSKLADKVDVRGEGGYVVAPPSIHPYKCAPYCWISTDPCSEMPAELLARLRGQPSLVVDMSAPPARLGGYAAVALLREVEAVRQAPEGQGNQVLNTAAFNLGQLVASGELAEAVVFAELLSAATFNGRRSEREARATIGSGLAGGAAHPRQRAGDKSPKQPQEILVPGSHVLKNGEYIEQGNHQFVSQVLHFLPRGALYRRGGKVGAVHDGAFVPIGADELRCVIDKHVRLVVWKAGKGEDAEPVESFRTCSRDLASLVLASAPVSRWLPELVEIVRAPVLLPGGKVLDVPGFDEASGVYFAPPPGVSFPKVPAAPTDADAREACARLLHPFREFPIDRIGRSVLLAFMLTLAARPCIAGPTPGLLVLAPDWAVGKSLLVRAATAAMTGNEPMLSPAPGGRAADAESEWRKRVTTTLLVGARVALVDNVKDGTTLTSESLEAVITANEWCERLLGGHESPQLKARTIWTASGVNITLGQALGRRCLRIEMHPGVEDSAARTFEIANLMAHVTRAHPHLVVDALTLLTRYLAVGAPTHGAAPLGSFEAWDALVRGAVVWATQADPVVSIQAARNTDPQRAALGALLEIWERKYPKGATAEQAARDATHGSDLLGVLDTLDATDDAGRAQSKLLGYKLRSVAGRRVGRRRFEALTSRAGRALWGVLTDRWDGAGDGGEIGGIAPHPGCADAREPTGEPHERWDGASAGGIPPGCHPVSHLAQNGLGDPAERDSDPARWDRWDETPLLPREEIGGGKRSDSCSSGESGVSSHLSPPEHTRVEPGASDRAGDEGGAA